MLANPSGQNLTSTFLETRNCFDLHTAFSLSPGFNVGAKQKKLGGGLVDAARSLATLIERGRGENKKWKLSFDHCWESRNPLEHNFQGPPRHVVAATGGSEVKF